jgi:hypothetical protein
VGGADHLIEEPQTMADTVEDQTAHQFTPGKADSLVWPGLMRRLNRLNPGYDH